MPLGKRLVFLGTGNMAEALLKGLLREGTADPDEIVCAEPRPERREEIADRYGVEVTADNRAAAALADLAVLSVKPQVMDALLTEIAPALEPRALVVSIAAGVPIMLFITFTLLMLQLHSFSRAMLVFLTGPLGIAGVAGALLALGRPFGFVALLGVIALMGMIQRNSVILIDQIEQDRERGVPAWDAIVESAVRRLRPIVLTAAAAVLAMIPLSRSVFWGPMAVAIMGGLIVATVLTLLALPAMYAAWFRVRRPDPEDVATA